MDFEESGIGMVSFYVNLYMVSFPMSLGDKYGVVFKGQDAGVRLCPFFDPALAIW